MSSPQRLEIAGKKFVLLEEEEYERLLGGSLPPLPEPDANGRYPALDFGRASLVRDLVRARRSAGLTPEQLSTWTQLICSSVVAGFSLRLQNSPKMLTNPGRVLSQTRGASDRNN